MSTRRYFLNTIAVAAGLVTAYFATVLTISAPIAGEYWVRESMIVKRHIAAPVQGSRLLFVGGSSALFGVDARAIGEALGMPALNLALHAGMRMERLLAFAQELARPGDVIVLVLEQPYYACDSEGWSDWQLRNVLAWDRDWFDGKPLADRLWAAYSGGGPRLLGEILMSSLGVAVRPNDYSERRLALAPADEVWARYQSGEKRTSEFAYSAYNLDDRGDMTGNSSARYSGAGVAVNEPDAICPDVLRRLKSFVGEMGPRNIRVLVAHAPYLIAAPPGSGWEDAEKHFARDLAATGAVLLDRRSDAFLPRNDFFDTSEHLNNAGRRERSARLIASFRAAGIGAGARGGVHGGTPSTISE